jgi:hypothetical protein
MHNDIYHEHSEHTPVPDEIFIIFGYSIKHREAAYKEADDHSMLGIGKLCRIVGLGQPDQHKQHRQNGSTDTNYQLDSCIVIDVY